MSSNLTWDDKARVLIKNLLKAQEDGRVSSSCLYQHHIHTPFELCEEILGKIEKKPVSDYLVMFNLEFLYAVMKLVDHDLDTVYYYTTDTNKAKAAIRLFPEVKIIDKLEDGMKFDVIVGNPPYQKSDDESSFTNLWADFVHKAFGMSKQYVAMITPKTWGNQVTKENPSSQVFGYIRKFGVVVNIDECRKHFPSIGSSFSYYVLDKNKKEAGCRLTTDSGELNIVWDEIPFIPNRFNSITLSIIKKILSRDVFEYVSSAGTVGDLVSERDDAHPYSVRYSMGTEKWSNQKHKFQDVPKLIFPNQTTKNYPIFAPNSAPANRGVFYVVRDEKHANQMLDYIKSKPIQFLISEQRTHHGVLNTQVIQRIPKIDLSRTWTDKELYDHFGLTEEERLHIDPEYKG